MDTDIVPASRPTAVALKTGLACAVLGALAGLDLEFMGAVGSSGALRGVVIGAVVGFVVGLLLGMQQGRYEAATATKPPRGAWAIPFGVACLALSVLSFIASQRVPGLRPIVVARAPLPVDRANSVQLSFTSDATGVYAVLLVPQENAADKVARDLGLSTGKKDSPAELPPREAVEWTSDVAGSQSTEKADVFQPSAAKYLDLGSLQAVEGRKYTLTVSVKSPSPAAQASNPHVEVHRSTATWAKAFPKLLVAGALGLLLGITGVMLIAYGGVQRWQSKQTAGKT